MSVHTPPDTTIPAAFDALAPGDLIRWTDDTLTEIAVITSNPCTTALLDDAVRYDAIIVTGGIAHPTTRIYDARDNAHLTRAARRRPYRAADLAPVSIEGSLQ